MHKFIVADPEKCTGCGVCELACSASKDKQFNSRMSRIRVVRIEPMINIAIACRLCEDPACVRCCPRNALRQAEETGMVVVDETRCDGCGWCVNACKFGAIIVHPYKKNAVVCDLCEGEEPLCVKFCLEQALELTTLDAVSEKARRSVIRELFIEKSSSP